MALVNSNPVGSTEVELGELGGAEAPTKATKAVAEDDDGPMAMSSFHFHFRRIGQIHSVAFVLVMLVGAIITYNECGDEMTTVQVVIGFIASTFRTGTELALGA